MKSDQELFLRTPIRKAVMRMAIHTVISSLVLVIYNMADTFFRGPDPRCLPGGGGFADQRGVCDVHGGGQSDRHRRQCDHLDFAGAEGGKTGQGGFSLLLLQFAGCGAAGCGSHPAGHGTTFAHSGQHAGHLGIFPGLPVLYCGGRTLYSAGQFLRPCGAGRGCGQRLHAGRHDRYGGEHCAGPHLHSDAGHGHCRCSHCHGAGQCVRLRILYLVSDP